MTDRPQQKKVVRKRPKTPSPSALKARKGFILVIFFIAQLMFFSSDFFKLQEIKVYGNNRVTDDQIIKTANIPLNKNIVTLPVEIFRKRLNSIHWIKKVRIQWTLPGRLHIFVEERKPEVLARQNGRPNEWYAIDKEGMTLYKAGKTEFRKRPRMVIDEEVAIGKKISVKSVNALKNIDPAFPLKVKKSILYYIVSDDGEVVVIAKRLGKNYKIKIGEVEGIPRKIELLTGILELLDDKKTQVEYIDLRFEQPNIKPVEAASTEKDEE